MICLVLPINKNLKIKTKLACFILAALKVGDKVDRISFHF